LSNGYQTSTPEISLIHASLTDPGCRREKNEDAITSLASDGAGRCFLMVVADGVGGTAAGEVASRIAVETVQDEVFRDGEPAEPAIALRDALLTANHAIKAAASENPLHAGMATTCTAAIVRGGELHVAHVGDCRAYLAGGGQLLQITDDHSMGAEYERQGQELPPDKQNLVNVLTRWLGTEDSVDVEVYSGLELAVGDTFVLCSDGLIKVVDDEEIKHTVCMHLPEGACRRLIDLARERGGPDNISVHVARLTRD
jgi:protein phosphatase